MTFYLVLYFYMKINQYWIELNLIGFPQVGVLLNGTCRYCKAEVMGDGLWHFVVKELSSTVENTYFTVYKTREEKGDKQQGKP